MKDADSYLTVPTKNPWFVGKVNLITYMLDFQIIVSEVELDYCNSHETSSDPRGVASGFLWASNIVSDRTLDGLTSPLFSLGGKHYSQSVKLKGNLCVMRARVRRASMRYDDSNLRATKLPVEFKIFLFETKRLACSLCHILKNKTIFRINFGVV